jgi:hypothetical protein
VVPLFGQRNFDFKLETAVVGRMYFRFGRSFVKILLAPLAR